LIRVNFKNGYQEYTKAFIIDRNQISTSEYTPQDKENQKITTKVHVNLLGAHIYISI